MSKEIAISYKWTEEFALKSAKDLYQYELKNSNKKFIGWFFIALAQFGVVGALKHNVYGFLVVATIGLVYWYFLRWPLREFFIKKSFLKSPFANQDINLIAKKDGIYKDDELQLKYSDIFKVAILEDAFILYHNLGTLYISNDAFTTQKDKELFEKYITITK